MFVIKPDGEKLGEPCADCGERTRSVWGYVYKDDAPRAAYFARWTPGHPERGMQLLASLGAWGPGATPSQRQSFGANARRGDDGVVVEVLDAHTLPWAASDFLGRPLTEKEALRDPRIEEALKIFEQVVAQDRRAAVFFAPS